MNDVVVRDIQDSLWLSDYLFINSVNLTISIHSIRCVDQRYEEEDDIDEDFCCSSNNENKLSLAVPTEDSNNPEENWKVGKHYGCVCWTSNSTEGNHQRMKQHDSGKVLYDLVSHRRNPLLFEFLDFFLLLVIKHLALESLGKLSSLLGTWRWLDSFGFLSSLLSLFLLLSLLLLILLALPFCFLSLISLLLLLVIRVLGNSFVKLRSYAFELVNEVEDWVGTVLNKESSDQGLRVTDWHTISLFKFKFASNPF